MYKKNKGTQYDEFFKTLLFQYKGLYDIALKDSFLCLYSNELSRLFKDSVVVVSPSAQQANQLRGFAPVATIASSFSNCVFTGLYKKVDYKQSDYTYEQRKDVIHKIEIKHGEFLTNKNVLILDDVLTSSSTAYACLKLVEAYKPQSIKLLILATNQTKEQIQEAIADQII
ncbi:MAG: phosphoribosyltransferase [Erysipelotrichaceae bacterium]|nr:phosphoribosyltransferase [Erysipelotrichaceae bacterium]